MEHVFWLEHHPRSISGLIEYLSKEDKVYCVCYDDDIFENRSSMGWSNDEFSNVEFIYLNRLPNSHEFLIKFCETHNDSINYIMGIRSGNISGVVQRYLLSLKKKKIFMIAERPYFYGKNRFESFLLRLLYRWYGFKYQNKITGVFAMGNMGVESYKKWSHGNVFPFLYPRFNNFEPNKQVSALTPIKALYVGQLDYRKGIDILIDVFNNLPSTIHLDVVGGNGNIQDKIKEKISNTPNVTFLGVWPSNDVARNMSSYDVCIVPSRYDGWGMNVMEALEAEVGVITTDQTGSKDLIYASGAGMVVKAGSFEELNKVLFEVVKNPSLTKEWKSKAREYKGRISQETVGSYVRNIVISSNSRYMLSVKCPWL